MKLIQSILLSSLFLFVIGCGGAEAKVEIKTPTIQCGMCQKTIEMGLSKVSGVTHSKVDLESKITHVVYDKSKVTEADIEKAITDLGYQANESLADPTAYESLPGCCKVGGGH